MKTSSIYNTDQKASAFDVLSAAGWLVMMQRHPLGDLIRIVHPQTGRIITPNPKKSVDENVAEVIELLSGIGAGA